MLHALLLSLLVTSPDPSTRTHAWRVVDQVSGAYKCEYACSTAAPDANRDTNCIQDALDVAAAGTKWNALELPSGVCLINAPLVVQYADDATVGLEIFGHGPPWTVARAPIGDAQWNSGTPIRGTVIQSSLTSGTILTLGTDYTVTSVDAGTDTLTLNSASLLSVNDAINIRCGAGNGPCVLPTPLVGATQYWVKTIAGDDITVSLTAGGATVDVTGWAALGAVHVSNSPGGHWKLRDFAILGNGASTRTTVGLGVVGASGIARLNIDGVTIANVGTGMECFTCEDSVASALTFYGNGVGFWGDGNTNSNVFTGIECGANNVCAILTGATNTFEGGTIQGSLQYGIRVLGGENRFAGIYFEDNSAVGAAISLEKASSWVLTALDTTTDVITVDGAAPADNTTVYLWVDGSTSSLPAAVTYGTAYHVWLSTANTFTLRTATAGGGSLIDFATAGTIVTVPGRTRMTAVAASNGAANFVDNNHYGTGDSLSVWTGGNQIDEINMAQTMKLHKGVTETRVWSAGACTDSGAGNLCETFTNGGLYYDFTGPAVASPGIFLTGADTMRLQQTTTAGLNFSYECRDALGYCQFRDATNDAAFLTLNPNGAGAPDNEVEIKAATLTVEGAQSIAGTLTCNTIDSTGAGTVIEGVTVNNGLVDGIDISVLSTQVNSCYAAVGDGVTDDTAALQACIDATPMGGTMFLAEGVYLITAGLTAIYPIYIHGTGTSGVDLADQFTFGSASWATATLHGTVIKTAMTTGTMLAMSNNDPHFMIRNVAFWNTAVGAHTTVGVSISSTGGNTPRPRLENVTVVNLSTGITMTGAACQASYLYLGGNDTGLSTGCTGSSDASIRAVNNGTAIKLTSAANEVLILDGYFSGNTIGIDILGGRANNIVGGLFTGNTTGILIEKSGGGATGTGGDQNSVRGAQFITNDPVSVYGSGNHFEFTGVTASPAVTLQTGASYNQTEYRGGFGGTYTDSSGQQNFRIMQSVNGLEWYDSDTISFEDGMISSTSATIGGATISAGDFSCAASTDHVYASLVDEFPASGTGVTADGVLLKDGDVSTAATGDFVKTDHVEEFTAANGVKVDSSGGVGTTTTIKDGYVAGIGFTSVDGTCGISVTDDATDAVLITATTLTANATTVDVNANLTPDRVTIMSSGGNVCRVIYNDSNGETTTGTILETVKTLTLPGGTVANDGDSLEFDAYVECDATANNKVFDFYFNGANSESSSQNCNGNAWHLHAIIWRRSSTTFDYEGSLSYTTEGSGTLHAYDTATWSSGTWATSQDFKFNLTTTDTGGAQLNGVLVKYCPAVP